MLTKLTIKIYFVDGTEREIRNFAEWSLAGEGRFLYIKHKAEELGKHNGASLGSIENFNEWIKYEDIKKFEIQESRIFQTHNEKEKFIKGIPINESN